MADLFRWYVRGITTPWKWLINGLELPLNLLAERIHLPEDLSTVTAVDPKGEVPPCSAGMTAEGVSAIWAAVEDLYRTGLYPAISFCLRRHGKIVLKRAIGHKSGNGPHENSQTSEMVTPETPLCLFSCSKAVTAMLVHLLSERRLLSLSDPVSRYLPEFGKNGKKEITILQLLRHQAGVHRLHTADANELAELIIDPKATINRICAAEADRPGGSPRYHAVTAGFIMGEIILRVTGQDCRRFLAENIQRPMGLTYFNYGIRSEVADRAATNYITGIPLSFPWTLYQRRVLEVSLERIIHLSNEPRFREVIIPSGNIYATAEECSRFFQLLLDGGTFENVSIFHPLTIRRAVQGSGTAEFDRNLLIPIRYSAGMMLGDSPFGIYGMQTKRAFGHWGITNNLCWADPERDITAALLTSGKPFLGSHIPKLIRFIMLISWHCGRLTEVQQKGIGGDRRMRFPAAGG